MSKWLIIGSTAAYHWFPDRKPPKDVDFLTPTKVLSQDPQACIIDTSWHDLAEEIISLNKDPVFADPDVLYTLKVSHAHWDINWTKTLYDIHDFQRRGCELNFPLYKKLTVLWADIHGPKKVNLNQSVETFWDDAVTRKYDHEFLHEIVKFNDRPMHELIRPDLSKTWCNEAMFDALDIDQQFQCAIEEILVTAIERKHLTKNNTNSDLLKSVNNAHKKLCTSMTTGWFARFLIINHHNILIERRNQWRNQLSKALDELDKL